MGSAHSKMFENTFSFTNMNSEWRPFILLVTLLGGSSATTRELPPCGSTCLPSFMRSGATFLHLCLPSLNSLFYPTWKLQETNQSPWTQFTTTHDSENNNIFVKQMYHMISNIYKVKQHILSNTKALMYHWLLKVK